VVGFVVITTYGSAVVAVVYAPPTVYSAIVGAVGVPGGDPATTVITGVILVPATITDDFVFAVIVGATFTNVSPTAHTFPGAMVIRVPFLAVRAKEIPPPGPAIVAYLARPMDINRFVAPITAIVTYCPVVAGLAVRAHGLAATV
jgi:hypothetical protein